MSRRTLESHACLADHPCLCFSFATLAHVWAYFAACLAPKPVGLFSSSPVGVLSSILFQYSIPSSFTSSFFWCFALACAQGANLRHLLGESHARSHCFFLLSIPYVRDSFAAFLSDLAADLATTARAALGSHHLATTLWATLGSNHLKAPLGNNHSGNQLAATTWQQPPRKLFSRHHRTQTWQPHLATPLAATTWATTWQHHWQQPLGSTWLQPLAYH